LIDIPTPKHCNKNLSIEKEGWLVFIERRRARFFRHEDKKIIKEKLIKQSTPTIKP